MTPVAGDPVKGIAICLALSLPVWALILWAVLR
jgi:hypothetical protein